MNYIFSAIVAACLLSGLYTAVKSRREPSLILLAFFFVMVATAFFFRIQ